MPPHTHPGNVGAAEEEAQRDWEDGSVLKYHSDGHNSITKASRDAKRNCTLPD